MASELFNTLTGYSVGIPAVQVIDSNGNVVSNFLNLSGNVSANKIYSNNYYYSNGQPFNSTPGGSNTQLQYNANGVFGGIANVTWNGSTLNLGSVDDLNIGGGVNGYVLQTDGTGNLSWTAQTGNGGGNGIPGGSNTQVQFNDAGTFGGDSGFTYNKITNTLQVENISSGDSLDDTVNVTGNLVVTGNVSISQDISDIGNIVSNGNITATYFIGNGSQLTNINTNVANYVRQNAQANITSLGNLAYVNIDGDLLSLGNITTSERIAGGELTIATNVYASNAAFSSKVTIGSNLTVNSSAILRVAGNINAAGSANISLGTISNIHITGGVNGYVLATDGGGNLSWAVNGGGGGNGSPGGANTQVQFNKNDNFEGSPYFTFNDYTNTVSIGGNLIANSVQMGAGVYKWSYSEVYFATTASTGVGQLLYSKPVANLSGIEFEIVATEPAGPSRQSCKISSLYYTGTVSFTEYASLFVNGGVGNFEVDYNAGNIIVPASIQLKVTPNTSTPVTYKMLITVYAD
jgi:hypothetical protein